MAKLQSAGKHPDGSAALGRRRALLGGALVGWRRASTCAPARGVRQSGGPV